MLLVVALLGGATLDAWGDETTLFNFSGQTNESAPTLSGSNHHQAANAQQVQMAIDPIFGGKFAFQSVGKGTGFYYTNTQLVQFQGDRYFSIVELEAGDKIVFTFSVADASSVTDKHFTVENCGTSSTTNLSLSKGGDAIAANTDLVSGTEYYVLADGYVDFKTRKNVYFDKVVITKPNSNVPDMECVWGQNFKSLGKEITFEITTDGGTCTSGKAVDGDAGYYYPSADEGSTAFTNENVGFYVAYASNGNHFRWKLYNGSNGLYNFKNGDNTVHIYNLTKGQIVKVQGSAFYNGSGVLSNWTGKDVDATTKTRYYKVDNAGAGILTVGKYEYIYSIEVFDATAYEFIQDNLTFEDAETYASGWSLKNNPDFKQVTSGTNKFLLFGAAGNNNNVATYTFNSLTQAATSWKLEFDWNGYGSSNNNSSYLDVRTPSNAVILRIYWKQYSDEDGNFGLQKNVSGTLTTFSTAVPYVHYDSKTRGSDTRAVPAYHFLLTADETNGVQLTVTNISTSATVVETTKISEFVNLGNMYAYVYHWYAAVCLDNVKSYVVADQDVVTAPTYKYTIHGNAPVVTDGETASGSTVKTYYSASKTDDPANDGTLWTNNSSTLPAAGTYYFYSVSDYSAGGNSAATTYSYIDGIYENYDFEAWVNDEGEVSFTSDATSFKGHLLNNRIGFAGNWKTVSNGIQGTSQGNEMHFKNMTSADKVILTFTGGYVRSYNSGSNFGYGSTMTNLTSGQVYSTDAGTNKLWDRHQNTWAVFTKVQVVTPTYTISAPTIVIGEATADATAITITPGTVINTDVAGATYGTLYITTDGSDPTDNNNENRVTSLSSLTTTSTVKAATYYDGAYSEITSQLVRVNVQLATPTIKLTGMSANGSAYVPTYTIAVDNSEVDGAPTATLTATYNGEDVDISSGTFTPNVSGTLVVKATATSYLDSEETSEDITAVYTEYWQSNDFSAMTASEVASAYPTWTNPGSAPGRWSYWNETTWNNFTTSDFYLVTNNASATSNVNANYSFDSHFQIRRNLAYLIMGYGIARGAGEALYITGTESGDVVAMKVYTGTGSKTVEAGSEMRYSKYTGSSIYLSTNHSNLLVQATIYRPVESVSKTVTSVGWATYCSPYALDFSSAITNLTDAYIVTGGTGDTEGVLVKTSVKGGTVPANTGLLLKGEGACTIPVVASSSTEVSSNKLVGVTSNTLIDAKAGYVLMNDATYGLNFYLNNNAFTVGANTAYLPANFTGGSARAAFYSFDDETTGINVNDNLQLTTDNSVYNLQGQRIDGSRFKVQGSSLKSGLYIINGKKVMVK